MEIHLSLLCTHQTRSCSTAAETPASAASTNTSLLQCPGEGLFLMSEVPL